MENKLLKSKYIKPIFHSANSLTINSIFFTTHYKKYVMISYI